MDFESDVKHLQGISAKLAGKLTELKEELASFFRESETFCKEMEACRKQVEAFQNFHTATSSNSRLKEQVLLLVTHPEMVAKRRKELKKQIASEQKMDKRVECAMDKIRVFINRLGVYAAPVIEVFELPDLRHEILMLQEQFLNTEKVLRETIYTEHRQETYLEEVMNTLITPRAKLTTINWDSISLQFHKVKDAMYNIVQVVEVAQGLLATYSKLADQAEESINTSVYIVELLERLFFREKRIIDRGHFYLYLMKDKASKRHWFVDLARYMTVLGEQSTAGFVINDNYWKAIFDAFNRAIEHAHRVYRQGLYSDERTPYLFNAHGVLLDRETQQATPPSVIWDDNRLSSKEKDTLVRLHENITIIKGNGNLIRFNAESLGSAIGGAVGYAFAEVQYAIPAHDIIHKGFTEKLVNGIAFHQSLHAYDLADDALMRIVQEQFQYLFEL